MAAGTPTFNSMMMHAACCANDAELPTDMVGTMAPVSVMAAASMMATSTGPIWPARQLLRAWVSTWTAADARAHWPAPASCRVSWTQRCAGDQLMASGSRSARGPARGHGTCSRPRAGETAHRPRSCHRGSAGRVFGGRDPGVQHGMADTVEMHESPYMRPARRPDAAEPPGARAPSDAAFPDVRRPGSRGRWTIFRSIGTRAQILRPMGGWETAWMCARCATSSKRSGTPGFTQRPRAVRSPNRRQKMAASWKRAGQAALLYSRWHTADRYRRRECTNAGCSCWMKPCPTVTEIRETRYLRRGAAGSRSPDQVTPRVQALAPPGHHLTLRYTCMFENQVADGDTVSLLSRSAVAPTTAWTAQAFGSYTIWFDRSADAPWAGKTSLPLDARCRSACLVPTGRLAMTRKAAARPSPMRLFRASRAVLPALRISWWRCLRRPGRSRLLPGSDEPHGRPALPARCCVAMGNRPYLGSKPVPVLCASGGDVEVCDDLSKPRPRPRMPVQTG
ncbi:hypothetical protein FQR65_LT20588 [Abscondita terminalis]|nr:hypothetical protein FQR65_LT20588 [Abscondita terminalis]